jgi:hypothetical protein
MISIDFHAFQNWLDLISIPVLSPWFPTISCWSPYVWSLVWVSQFPLPTSTVTILGVSQFLSTNQSLYIYIYYIYVYKQLKKSEYPWIFPRFCHGFPIKTEKTWKLLGFHQEILALTAADGLADPWHICIFTYVQIPQNHRKSMSWWLVIEIFRTFWVGLHCATCWKKASLRVRAAIVAWEATCQWMHYVLLSQTLETQHSMVYKLGWQNS